MLQKSSIYLAERMLTLNKDGLTSVAEKYPVMISQFLSKRIKNGNYSLQAARQYLPDIQELQDSNSLTDPCNEGLHKQDNNIIQKYNNRIAIILTQRCLSYCRFCFRKHFVGYNDHCITSQDLDKAIAFVEKNTNCVDILLSGGDPLALSNNKLLPFLERLCRINHVKVLRIHTRALSLVPQRINNELIDFLSQNRMFWFYCHMNHPDDLNHEEVLKALRKIQNIGVPVLN